MNNNIHPSYGSYLITGAPGTGKSLIEIFRMHLDYTKYKNKNSMFFVIDNWNEFRYHNADDTFNVNRIKADPYLNKQINIMDLYIADISSDSSIQEAIALKAKFIISFMEEFFNHRFDDDFSEYITNNVFTLYEPYINHLRNEGLHIDQKTSPVFVDLLRLLKKNIDSQSKLREAELIHLTECINHDWSFARYFTNRTNVNFLQDGVNVFTDDGGLSSGNIYFMLVFEFVVNVQCKINSAANIDTFMYADSVGKVGFTTNGATISNTEKTDSSFMQYYSECLKTLKKYNVLYVFHEYIDNVKMIPNIFSIINGAYLLSLSPYDRTYLQKILRLSEYELEQIRCNDFGAGLYWSNSGSNEYFRCRIAKDELSKIL